MELKVILSRRRISFAVIEELIPRVVASSSSLKAIRYKEDYYPEDMSGYTLKQVLVGLALLPEVMLAMNARSKVASSALTLCSIIRKTVEVCLFGK